VVNDIIKNAKQILDSDVKLKEFSDLNRLGIDAARLLLERLIEKPEMAKEFNDYIFSSERSEDFKGYTAGEEKGYQRGHEAGFAKGAALTVIGALTIAGLAFLSSRNK